MNTRVTICRLLLILFVCWPCAAFAQQTEEEQRASYKETVKFLKKVDVGNVHELVSALQNPVYREFAKATLVKIGAPSVKPLLEELEKPDLENEKVIVETLGMLGPVAKDSWPLLLQKSRTKDLQLSNQIVQALVQNGPDVVPVLIAGLKDPDSAIRNNSARMLSQLGPVAEPAVPALRAGLQAKSERSLVRNRIILALAAIGPAAEPAIPELLQALATFEEKERYLPAQALGEIGPPARPAIPQLIAMLRQRKIIRNGEAAQKALVGIGVDSVPQLLVLLKDKGRDPYPSDIAGLVLVQLGRPAVPLLLPQLENQDPVIVERVAMVLLQIGEPAVADMLSLMQSSSNSEVQFVLAQILARIPAAAHMAVPGLMVGLQERDPAKRLAAAQALAVTGPAAFQAFPLLINALQSDLEIAARRYGADFPNTYAGAIGSALMAGGEQAILPLHQAMVHDHAVVRSVATQAMAGLGEHYRSIVVPRMVGSLMMANNPRLKEGAMSALSIMQPTRITLAKLGPKAIPGLTEAVRYGPPPLRLSAAQALAMLGEPSVTSLVECLVEPSLEVRLVAVQSLGAMGSVAEPAVPALIHALDVEEDKADSPNIPDHIWEEFKQHIALALGDIGAPAVPKLIPLLKSDEKEMQLVAAIAFSRMGKDAAPAVEHLRESLRQSKLEVRTTAITALHRIGPAAIDAAPELLQLLREPVTDFRGKSNEAFLLESYYRSLADTLARFGQPILPELLPLIQDSNQQLKDHVAYAIYKIGLGPGYAAKIDPELEDLFIAALKDKSLVVRVVAANGLSLLGTRAEKAIPDLIQAVRTSHEVIGDDRFDEEIASDYLASIVNALANIGEASIEPLLAASQEENQTMRGVAAWAMFRLAPDSRQLVQLGEGVIPVLLSALHREKSEFSTQALEALSEMGDVGVKALLKKIQEHRLGYLSSEVKALTKMHETSSSALVEALADPDPYVRAVAARALGGPAPANEDSIPISEVIDGLTKAREDESPEVRANAEHSLFWLDARLAKSLGIENPAKKFKLDPLPPRDDGLIVSPISPIPAVPKGTSP